MSEAKSGARPRQREADAEQDTGRDPVADGREAQPSHAAATKPGVTSWRLSVDDAADLDVIKGQLDTAKTAEAIRYAVTTVAATLRSSTTAEEVAKRVQRDVVKAQAAQKVQVSDLNEATLQAVTEGLTAVSDGYSARAQQLQAIGNNVNQIVKHVHVGRYVDDAAVFAVESALEDVLHQMERDAERDSDVQTMLRQALP